MRFCVLTAKIPPENCGVGDYSINFCREVASRGHDVLLICRNHEPISRYNFDISDNIQAISTKNLITITNEIKKFKPDLVTIQWAPFLYAKRGLTLAIPLLCLWLIINKQKFSVMVHELWASSFHPLRLFQEFWQRSVAYLLLVSAKYIGVSIEAWTQQFQQQLSWKKTRIQWQGVASNIDYYAPTAEEAKSLQDKFNLQKDKKYITIFSPTGSGKGLDLINYASEKLSQLNNIEYLVIGSTPDETRRQLTFLDNSKNTHWLGFCDDHEVSYLLQQTYLALIPFIDGISTRRGSALAGLANGTNILTTYGFLYDIKAFENAPIHTTHYDIYEFADKATQLVKEESALYNREEILDFYANNLNWQKHVDRFLVLIGYKSV